MPYVIEFDHNEDFVRAANWVLLKARVGRFGLPGLALVYLFAAILGVLNLFLGHVLFGIGMILLVAWSVGAWVVNTRAHIRRTVEPLVKLGETRVTYTFAESGMEQITAAGGGTVSYNNFTKLVRNRDFWLFYAGMGYYAIPANQLSEEGRDFVMAQLKGSGTRIIDI